MPYSALVDQGTQALLTLTAHPYVAAQLCKSPTLKADQYHAVDWPNYKQDFPLLRIPRAECPKWSWTDRLRLFQPTPEHVLTDELQERSALASVKARFLWQIIYELSVARYQIWRGVLMQEYVYAAKRREALEFRDPDHPNRDPLALPFLSQYAEHANITMHEAADEILFNAKLDDGILLRTERLRLKYFNMVRDVPTLDELNKGMTAFYNEAHGRRTF